MKSLLIITPYFAPQSHAAVFRAYKLAKYLPRLGWKVIVLTTDTNYLYREDAGLLKDLPPDVEIIRTRYIEPTLRGVRMALGGADRSVKALSRKPPSPAAPNRPATPARRSLSRQAYQFLLDHLLQVPDPFWTWRRTALPRARELIRKHGIRVVLTSSAPYTTIRMGHELQQSEGVRWVADFRDMLTLGAPTSSKLDRIFLQQRALERLAVTKADALTVLTSAAGPVYADLYGPGHAVHFIPTGLDEELLPPPAELSPEQPQEPPFVLFVGEYHSGYSGRFFELFARALKTAGVRETGIRVKVVGRLDLNRPTVLPIVERLGITDRVDLIEQMPQKELYRLLERALAAFLGDGQYQWWNMFAKLVDTLAMRKPVLACVPDPSEARKWLQLSRLGVFLDGDDSAAAAKLGAFLLSGGRELPPPDEEVCARFTAKKQAQAFSDLLEPLTASPHDKDRFPPEALEELQGCPHCGQASSGALGDDFRIENGFPYVICSRCRLIYLRLRLRREHSHLLYDRDGYHDVTNLPYHRRTAAKRLKLLTGLPPGARIHEDGAGMGAFVEASIKAGYRTTGSDSGADAVQKAQHHFNVELHRGEFSSISMEPASLDAFVAFNLLSHLYEPWDYLTRAAQLIKPGGKLLLRTGDRQGRFLNYGTLGAPEHLFHFDRALIGTMLTKAGFRMVQVRPAFDSDYPNLFRAHPHICSAATTLWNRLGLPKDDIYVLAERTAEKPRV